VIPNDYIDIFNSFKQFVDDLIDEDVDDQGKTPSTTKKSNKRKNAIKSKDKRREEFDYHNDSYNENSQVNQESAIESKAKFMNDGRESTVSKFNNESANINDSNKSQNVQNKEITGITSDQKQAPNNVSQNNPNFLMQMLASQANGAQAQHNYGQMNQGYIAGQMGMFSPANIQSAMQANSQSLLLLQRIIQTTPEIQFLHQQEQIALYQIQQNIKAALSQNLGQEVISHLVLEYQKTQEQHQLRIQAAIQRKLTLILCQNNPQFMNTQLFNNQNEQYEQEEEPQIEK